MPELHTAVGDGSHEPVTTTAGPQSDLDWTKLDALLEALPPGIPALPPDDAGNFEKYTHRPRHVYAPGDGWRNCARALEKYDAELCKGYREEIDTLLVFAGLFSAVVTAFTIESYQWLQTDPNDAIIVLLSQIAQSVSHNNTAGTLIPASPGLSGAASVRINVYWFLALALSLSAALVGILCKQWIREFERNTMLSPKVFVRVHQTKLEGLENWRVGGIISLLPLLLQLALAMFALGALELLWQLHIVVVTVVCIPTVVVFAFYTATTVIPALQYPRSLHFGFPGFDHRSFWDQISECPYKSPQALLVFPLYGFSSWLKNTAVSGALYLIYRLSPARYHLATTYRLQDNVWRPWFLRHKRLDLSFPTWHGVSMSINNWLDMTDEPQPLSIYRSLRWIHLNLDDGDVTEWIWRALWEAEASDERDFSSEDTLKRGICHVERGVTDVPQSGSRALVLAYLLQTHVPGPFLVEVFCQHLSQMDVLSATYLANRLHQQLFSGLRLGSKELVTILPEASAYGLFHIHEPIGEFLANIALLSLNMSDISLRRLLLGCTLLLYHSWLGLQPAPHEPATLKITEDMIQYSCRWVLVEHEEYRVHPERLRQRPGVQELAALTSIFAQAHEEPEAAFTALMRPWEEALTLPLMRELLDIALQGDAATPFAVAEDGGLAPLTSTLSPSPATPSLSHVEQSLTEEAAQSHIRHDTARGVMSRTLPLYPLSSYGPAVAVEDSEAQDGLSRSGSGPPDSPTLRAVVMHAPSGEHGHAQTLPALDVEARPRTHGQDGGDCSGTDVRLSAAVGLKPDGAPLQVIVTDAPSGKLVQPPSPEDDDEARPRTDGDTGADPSAADTEGASGGDARMLPEDDRAAADGETDDAVGGIDAQLSAVGGDPRPDARMLTEDGCLAAARERDGAAGGIDAHLSQVDAEGVSRGKPHDPFHPPPGADARTLPGTGDGDSRADGGREDPDRFLSRDAHSGGTLRAGVEHAPSGETPSEDHALIEHGRVTNAEGGDGDGGGMDGADVPADCGSTATAGGDGGTEPLASQISERASASESSETTVISL